MIAVGEVFMNIGFQEYEVMPLLHGILQLFYTFDLPSSNLILAHGSFDKSIHNIDE